MPFDSSPLKSENRLNSSQWHDARSEQARNGQGQISSTPESVGQQTNVPVVETVVTDNVPNLVERSSIVPDIPQPNSALPALAPDISGSSAINPSSPFKGQGPGNPLEATLLENETGTNLSTPIEAALLLINLNSPDHSAVDLNTSSPVEPPQDFDNTCTQIVSNSIKQSEDLKPLVEEEKVDAGLSEVLPNTPETPSKSESPEHENIQSENALNHESLQQPKVVDEPLPQAEIKLDIVSDLAEDKSKDTSLNTKHEVYSNLALSSVGDDIHVLNADGIAEAFHQQKLSISLPSEEALYSSEPAVALGGEPPHDAEPKKIEIVNLEVLPALTGNKLHTAVSELTENLCSTPLSVLEPISTTEKTQIPDIKGTAEVENLLDLSQDSNLTVTGDQVIENIVPETVGFNGNLLEFSQDSTLTGDQITVLNVSDLNQVGTDKIIEETVIEISASATANTSVEKSQEVGSVIIDSSSNSEPLLTLGGAVDTRDQAPISDSVEEDLHPPFDPTLPTVDGNDSNCVEIRASTPKQTVIQSHSSPISFEDNIATKLSTSDSADLPITKQTENSDPFQAKNSAEIPSDAFPKTLTSDSLVAFGVNLQEPSMQELPVVCCNLDPTAVDTPSAKETKKEAICMEELSKKVEPSKKSSDPPKVPQPSLPETSNSLPVSSCHPEALPYPTSLVTDSNSNDLKPSTEHSVGQTPENLDDVGLTVTPHPCDTPSFNINKNLAAPITSTPITMENNRTNATYEFEFDENINPFETRCKLAPANHVDNAPLLETTRQHHLETEQFALPKPPAAVSQKRKKKGSSPSSSSSSMLGPDVTSDTSATHQADCNFPTTPSGPETFLIDDDIAKYSGDELKEADPAFLQKHSKGNRRRVEKVSTCTKSTEAAASQELSSSPTKMTESFEAVVREVESISTRSIEGSLPNQSEAGPDVAQFTEEEFCNAAEFFKDPVAFEFLQKASNSKTFQKSTLGRLSLYVKFDPLLKNGSPVGKCSPGSGCSSKLDRSQPSKPELAVDIPGPSSQPMDDQESVLIDFNASYGRLPQGSNERTRDVHSEPDLVSSHCQEQKMFTEDELNQALKMQELLYQEKLIKKEKTLTEVQKAWDRDKTKMSSQVTTMREALSAKGTVIKEMARLLDMCMQAKESQRVEITESNHKLIKERDQALEDLQNVETAFGDLHRRYEKAKAALESYKQHQEELTRELEDSQNKLKKQEQMYNLLRSRTEEKLDSANVEIETARKSGEAELAALKAQLKKAEMRISSLEKGLEQKMNENAELSNICDELIAKVGKV